MSKSISEDFRGVKWLTLDPNFVIVTTLLSDLYHLRPRGATDDRMLCGRQIDAEARADYPAKAVKVDELCKQCLASYQRRERSLSSSSR